MYVMYDYMGLISLNLKKKSSSSHVHIAILSKKFCKKTNHKLEESLVTQAIHFLDESDGHLIIILLIVTLSTRQHNDKKWIVNENAICLTNGDASLFTIGFVSWVGRIMYASVHQSHQTTYILLGKFIFFHSLKAIYTRDSPIKFFNIRRAKKKLEKRY